MKPEHPHDAGSVGVELTLPSPSSNSSTKQQTFDATLCEDIERMFELPGRWTVFVSFDVSLRLNNSRVCNEFDNHGDYFCVRRFVRSGHCRILSARDCRNGAGNHRRRMSGSLFAGISCANDCGLGFVWYSSIGCVDRSTIGSPLSASLNYRGLSCDCPIICILYHSQPIPQSPGHPIK